MDGDQDEGCPAGTLAFIIIIIIIAQDNEGQQLLDDDDIVLYRYASCLWSAAAHELARCLGGLMLLAIATPSFDRQMGFMPGNIEEVRFLMLG